MSQLQCPILEAGLVAGRHGLVLRLDGVIRAHEDLVTSSCILYCWLPLRVSAVTAAVSTTKTQDCGPAAPPRPAQAVALGAAPGRSLEEWGSRWPWALSLSPARRCAAVLSLLCQEVPVLFLAWLWFRLLGTSGQYALCSFPGCPEDTLH